MQTGRRRRLDGLSAHCVSASAKIPIVPVEFSPPLDVVNRSPLHTEEVLILVKGENMQELKELQRQGMSIQAITELTGWDRKTMRKYMQAAGVVPDYGPRPAQPSKLDAFKPYLEKRLRAGVWNAGAASDRHFSEYATRTNRELSGNCDKTSIGRTRL
jgi:hypothetical protein